MRHNFDPARRIYRTEYPAARLLDYVLMLVLAFVVGAVAVMALMIRVYAESRPSYGAEHVPATSENMTAAYHNILMGGAIGGTVTAILCTFLIVRSRRELREREEQLRQEQLRDLRKKLPWGAGGEPGRTGDG